MKRAFFALILFCVSLSAAEPFATRGYYITFMRMPVMGLPEWKGAMDAFAEDDVNTLILWTAGGFASKKYPITWKYNADHENIRRDFVRELIDYAHTKKIRVLLGFTPFGYDGVNQLGLENPELRARKADGSVVDQFGIHSWGWNLCAAKEESQKFMREYVSEMMFDFYPNADGMLIESSDYNICRCPNCGTNYYTREFEFVRWISDEVWKRNARAQIVVYPHYFTGKRVPGMDAVAARQKFDSRWSLLFTPHSAHFEEALIKQAAGSIYSDDSPVLRTPEAVAAAARAARAHGVTGYVPSLEAFSYVTDRMEAGEPAIVGKRRTAFGTDAKMPFNELTARVQRFAFREFSQDPGLDFSTFKKRLGTKFEVEANDLLDLQRIWVFEAEWYFPSPLLDPDFFKARAARLKWNDEKRAPYRANLDVVKRIARDYKDSGSEAGKEMHRLASEVVARWKGEAP